MKRRTSLEFDSLELLLDTICNTFGGILFLAVLVIILVHRTGESFDQTGRADLLTASTLQSDLDQRKGELQSLQRAFQEYRTTLAGLETEQAAEQARRVVKLRRGVTDLTSRRMEFVQRFASLSQDAAELEQLRDSASSSLALARKEAQSLERQLENEHRHRTRTVNLPMLRQTSKREFPLILRFGRLYLPFIAETSLVTRKSNLNDFVVLDDEGAVVRVTPKPNAGLPLSGSDQFFDSLRHKLTSLDNKSVYLAIGVWEDSFDNFQDLKEAIVRLGFEYRLVPVAGGEFIQESPVKETLVQ